MSKFKVSLAGEEIGVLDEEAVTLKDAFAIKAASGLNLKPFISGLNDMDPLSLQTLVWFLRHKNGDQAHISDVDFKIADLELEPVEDAQEQDPKAEPTSASDETGTSAS